MKMFTCCAECMKMNLGSKVSSGIGNLNEEGYIDFTCKYGHHSNIFLQEFKFEYLFYQAIKHFVIAEYEESVMLFANSLERFYEFFIKLYARKMTHDDEYIDKSLIKTLKFSERQLGAFNLLYFIIFKEAPPKLSEKKVNLRNNVVHNGKLILEEEAFEFGNEVYKIITSTITKIKNKDKNIISIETDARIKNFNDYCSANNIKIDGTATNYINFTIVNEISTFEKLIDSVHKMENLLSPIAIQKRDIAAEILEKENQNFINIIKKIIEEQKLIKNIDYPLKESAEFIVNHYKFENNIKKYVLLLKIDEYKFEIIASCENDKIAIKNLSQKNN